MNASNLTSNTLFTLISHAPIIMKYSDLYVDKMIQLPEISRILDIENTLSRKSCLLLGPRQTGKSWLIRQRFPSSKVFNLLDLDTYRALSQRPRLIRDESPSDDSVVIIDEIQKIPELLDEVHLAIEERRLRFLLTGSSARKLKKAGVNLLGGRARTVFFHPLVRAELRKHFNLKQALSHGLLPAIYFSTSARDDLKDYVETYLREEIAIETSIRSLPVFSRFLDVAALCNSQLINFTEIGNDAQIPPTTIREYFSVLEDTLIARLLPAWKESKKRKAFSTSKFYFFDVGVVRYLQGRTELAENTTEFGEALETYLFHELSAYVDYISGEQLCYWRSTSGIEVDFLLGDHTAIEVKATRRVTPKHMRGLEALREENVFKNYILVSQDSRERVVNGIEVVTIESFLDKLWDGKWK